MGAAQKRIVKAMQDVGLVAKPTLFQVVAQTSADAVENTTQAVGELSMAGLKATGRSVRHAVKRVGKSEAVHDLKSVGGKARGAAGPLVSTAVAGMLIQGITSVIRSGLTAGFDAAAEARRNRGIAMPGRPATETVTPRHRRPRKVA